VEHAHREGRHRGLDRSRLGLEGVACGSAEPQPVVDAT
jgi:hypothetical protein